ncbi:hypothetical protein [Halorarius litoreus]|uniref:hypothetical protein n=1 Tax=Halorarius litoreus TaxID=2962676 RepID=UPI0020CDAF33|nr:hypothetical protein [Halorarius litoreus]
MTAPKPTSDGTVDRPTPWADGPPSRYDLVLAVIPLTLLAGSVAGLVSPLELHDTMLAAGLVAAFVLADVLFRNPPHDPT